MGHKVPDVGQMVSRLAPLCPVGYGDHMDTKTPLTVTTALSRVIEYRLRDQRVTKTEAAQRLGIGRETFRNRLAGPAGFKMAELELLAPLLNTTVTDLSRQAEAYAHTVNQRAAS